MLFSEPRSARRSLSCGRLGSLLHEKIIDRPLESIAAPADRKAPNQAMSFGSVRLPLTRHSTGRCPSFLPVDRRRSPDRTLTNRRRRCDRALQTFFWLSFMMIEGTRKAARTIIGELSTAKRLLRFDHRERYQDTGERQAERRQHHQTKTEDE